MLYRMNTTAIIPTTGPTEREILAILWEHGPLTVRQVRYSPKTASHYLHDDPYRQWANGRKGLTHTHDHGCPVQRHAHAESGNGAAFQLPANLANFSGGGQPLPPDVRHKMESFFGASFGEVRVHVGPHASAIGA